MIRFPPTSIALSDSDIDFHFREIQIKEQLYAQGFTKKEVQRYYGQRHGDINDVDDDDIFSSKTPSPDPSFAKAKEEPANLLTTVGMVGATRRISGRPVVKSNRVSSDESLCSSDPGSHSLFRRALYGLTGTDV